MSNFLDVKIPVVGEYVANPLCTEETLATFLNVSLQVFTIISKLSVLF